MKNRQVVEVSSLRTGTATAGGGEILKQVSARLTRGP